MHRSTRSVTFVWLGLALSAGLTSLEAQAPALELGEPDARHPEAFSRVGGIRELADRRVMVADPLGQALVVVDLDRGSADTLGRPGQGPAEYRQPDALFALPGDSTLLVDLGNGRLTALGPDGGFGETMPIGQGGPGRGGMLLVLPRGVDSRGRLYFQAMGGGPGRQLPDSAAVLRLDRAGGAIDTVAMVKLEGRSRRTSGGPSNQNVMIRSRPLTPQDGWAVTWDGQVAVARSGDYHLEWIGPDGRIVRGRPVPYEPVRIRQADKEEWLDASGSGLRVSVEMTNGRRRMSLSRGGGRPRGAQASDYEWPDTKPAFVGNGVWVTPSGDAWVLRHVPAGSPRTVDVFGPDGNRKATVVLPPGRTLAGFGKGSVYLAHTDEDELQHLERYRVPTT